MRDSRLPLLPLLLACSLAVACGPPTNASGRVKVDGGWVGTYQCGADSKRFTATLAENDDGDLGGEGFLDYQLVLVGTPYLFTARAEIKDGSRTEDGDVVGTLDVLDNGTAQLADFAISLTPNDDTDDLDGELAKLDGDGQPTDNTCDAHLSRTTP